MMKIKEILKKTIKLLGKNRTLSQTKLILLVSLFIASTGNLTFFSKSLEVHELSFYNISAIVFSALFLFGLISILLFILCIKHTTKPVLILILLISSCASYFTDTYDIIMSKETIGNILNTEYGEAVDLLNLDLFSYFFFLGLIPSILIYRSQILYKSLIKEILSKIICVLTLSLMVGAIVLTFSTFYVSLFKIHHNVAYRANPIMWVRSTITVSYKAFFKNGKKNPLKKAGEDAKIYSPHKKIVIMVVGEALRADKLPFNGYHRNTMPLLSKESIVNLPDVTSCATSTFIALPCMFSIYDRTDYSHSKAKSTENTLDVLSHTGKVKILWEDNNFGDKGVAARIDQKSFMSKNTNKKCDHECRDEGMLIGAEEYIK